ncbi:MAG: hypothetical protein GEV03_18485 [Streptosporangiales bacterium]|nr:hypothetical protein [Streptosporangiales bacterium]
MPWVLAYVILAVAGLAVLAVCGLRVFRAVRELGREVRRTEERLEPSLLALEQATDHVRCPHE